MKAHYQLLRAARAALGIEHIVLAKEARVSKRTLVRVETLRNVSDESRARVQAALEARGVEFFPSEGDRGPGIRVPEKALIAPTVRRHEPGRRIDRKVEEQRSED
ncbi:MAG: helix-turn-helix domain-containing protein [Mesorhizobium sp.]